MYWKQSAVTRVCLIDFLSSLAQESNLYRGIHCDPGVYIYSSQPSKKQKLGRRIFYIDFPSETCVLSCVVVE